MILALRQKFDILEDKLIFFHVVRWSHFLHGERFMGPVIHNIWRTYHVVSPHANRILPQHRSAGAPSLHPKLSAARDDWDCFKDVRASSLFFFFLLENFFFFPEWELVQPDLSPGLTQLELQTQTRMPLNTKIQSPCLKISVYRD